MAPLNLDTTRTMNSISADSFQSKRNKRQSISFDQVLARAVESANTTGHNRRPSGRTGGVTRIVEEEERRHKPKQQRVLPPRPPLPQASTYESQILKRAANRMSAFMSARVKDIHRLSKTSNAMTLEHAMSVYGPPATRVPSPSGSESHGSYSSDEESPVRAVAPLAPRRALGPPVDTGRPLNTHSRQGSYNTPVPSRYKDIPRDMSRDARSDAGSVAGSVRTTRKVASRSDLDMRTFSRHLSLKPGTSPGGGSSRGGSPSEPPPPVPSRSHW